MVTLSPKDLAHMSTGCAKKTGTNCILVSLIEIWLMACGIFGKGEPDTRNQHSNGRSVGSYCESQSLLFGVSVSRGTCNRPALPLCLRCAAILFCLDNLSGIF